MKLLNKVKISLLIAFFIIVLFNLNVFAVQGEITEITVNLRSEPSTSGKKLMYVTQDDKVEVLEKVGDWYKIKFKNTTGYVFGEYIKVDDSKLVEKEDKKDTELVVKEDTTVKKDDETKKEDTKIEDVTMDVPLNLQIKNNTGVKIIPNISSSVIYTSKTDISVTVLEQLDKWSYVLVDNVYGWVRTDTIIEENSEKADVNETDISQDNKTEEKISYIKYDTVNLRKQASTSSKILAKLKLNDEVTVLEKVDNTWSKVKVDGQVGYVSTELLADEKQKVVEKEESTTSRDGESTSRDEKDKVIDANKEETKVETTDTPEEIKKEETNKETVSSKVTGEDIVAYAKNYLGYKYVLGASSPSKGFDCSGLTYYVYKHFGYTISRTSKTQANDGRGIAKSDIKPGDLLIFKNQDLKAIGHVGIYIGNNKMIHSSEPGVGVVITDLDARGYNYDKRYVTARRIID